MRTASLIPSTTSFCKGNIYLFGAGLHQYPVKLGYAIAMLSYQTAEKGGYRT